MSRSKVLSVVGTRPNFMKIAPVQRALGRFESVDHVLVHTGQHYDAAISAVFFDELGIDEPARFLGIGSGTHAQQLARVIEGVEPVLRWEAPDLVLVVGDVNSTLAAALAATSLGIDVGHVEAGLRSFDRTMPEEVNRNSSMPSLPCSSRIRPRPARTSSGRGSQKMRSTRWATR